jgi:ferric-dicitrate binding protein FerR (iron transport regulator)
MGNFECNNMEDLVFSRSFRNWVLNRESSETGFWENWIARNPDKAELVRYAKAVIYALHLNTATLSEEVIDDEVRKALLRLKEAPRYIPLDGPDGQPGRGWARGPRPRRFMVAATLFLAIALAGFLFYRTGIHPHRDGLQSFLAGHKSDPVPQQAVDALTDQTISLPDGSVVRLTKGSRLYYSAKLAGGSREVFLEGEAWFEIKKNAPRPFYVYTGQVITKVLGTGFIVRSLSSDSVTTVTVRTGKVSVYREDDYFSPSAEKGEPAGIILIPNQQVVYDREKDRLYKTLAASPERLAETPDTPLVFQGTPVNQVFGRLQQWYGIPIVFDEEAVSSCSLNATMGEKDSFYERLNMICKAIGASYEDIDGTIVVTVIRSAHGGH